MINDEAAKARNLFPEVQKVRADYNDFATLVTKAAMKMISTQEPTQKVLAELQAELERQRAVEVAREIATFVVPAQAGIQRLRRAGDAR